MIGLATRPATGGKLGPGDGCKYGAAAGDEGSFTMHADDGRGRAGAVHGVPADADKEASAAAAEVFLPPVPRELTTVFVAVPQSPPPAKKMLVHRARCRTVCASRHMLPRDIVPAASAGKSSEALLISHSHTTLAVKFS